EGVNTLPAWSPDGKRLAYVSQRGPLPSGWGSRVLVIRSVETGEERVLNPKLGRLSLPLHTPPQWSPDGRTLLVVGRDVKGVPGIYLIDSESAAVTTVVRGSPGREIIRSAVWSRHGRSILYVIQLSEQNTLLAEGSPLIEHDLKTGQEKTLLGRSPKPFALSPDGKRIALCCFEGEVRLMPSSGGEQTTIFKRSEDQWINAQVAGFQWTPDGESLLFVNLNRKANKSELWQLSVATGEARKTGLEMNGTSNEAFRTLAMHPDGRRIAFVSGDVDPEVWVMENFLPGVEAKKAPAARR
ncbi:MAG TPA: hypothetical protein VLD57_06310, partial [Blastocatellia bacterium]|nr:hypothetical protein [Blastocatellia bacterium]